MRTICERCLDKNKDVYACFIDYEKAFDRVNHQKMIECLSQMGVDSNDVKFIRNLYWGQQAYVRMKEMSDVIDIRRGVRQVSVLSPILFNIYTELIFRQCEHLKGINVGGVNVKNFRYADDTVLLAESAEQLQDIVDAVNRVGKEWGMKMNAKKTDNTY